MKIEKSYSFTLDKVREFFNFCAENNINFREFIEHIDGGAERAENIMKSIRNEFCNFDEVLKDDIFEHDGFMYSVDYYVTTREGDILHNDDAYFCEYFEAHTSGETTIVNIGRKEKQYCDDAINQLVRSGELIEFNGEYYDRYAQERHGIVYVEDIREYDHIENVYYHDEEERYYTYPPKSDENYVRDYHSDKTTHVIEFSNNPQFFIGYEVEKEDKDVKESIYIYNFEEECEGWRKERDGSLDDDSGYELISPIFELNSVKIRKEIEKSETIKNHINAEKSNRCGGHINLSERGLTGMQLFEKLQGYTPLFYALYYKRINKTYSKGKNNKDLKEENDKYQAIRIHDNRIEYRIVSAVPDVNTLIWRTKLIELIVKHPTNDPQIAFFYILKYMKKHLKKMYKHNFEVLMARFIQYSLSFEEIEIQTETEVEA